LQETQTARGNNMSELIYFEGQEESCIPCQYYKQAVKSQYCRHGARFGYKKCGDTGEVVSPEQIKIAPGDKMQVLRPNKWL